MKFKKVIQVFIAMLICCLLVYSTNVQTSNLIIINEYEEMKAV